MKPFEHLTGQARRIAEAEYTETLKVLPSVITSPRLRVFREVEQRRLAQDAQHGGPDHDDKHPAEEWIGLIDYHNQKSMPMAGADNIAWAEYRSAMLDVAALAVAAIEVIDRKAAKANQ